MSALLNLEDYIPLFEPDKIDFAQALTLPFFDGCDFDSPTWSLREKKNEGKLYKLEFERAPIGSGYRLGDNPDLLRAVKMSCIFVYSANKTLTSKTASTAESISKYHTDILGFLRCLNKLGIQDMRFINQAVAEAVWDAYTNKTAEERLGLEELGMYALQELFDDPDRLKTYKRLGNSSGAKPRFDYTRFTEELGVSLRAFQSIRSFQELRIELCMKHGFEVQRKKLQGSAKESEERGEASIRKPLGSIKSFLRTLHVAADLFPESQRTSAAWFEERKVSQAAKKHGKVVLTKTRNIPRTVFYKLMDEAIRWVVDYADELLEYRDRVLQERQRIYQELMERTEGKDKDNWKRSQALMKPWFYENQPNKFPYPVDGIERTPNYDKENSKDLTKVERARALRAEGLSYQKIADAIGCVKGSVEGYLNHKPPLNGTAIGPLVYSHLVTACALVIFAFTARREGEVKGLKVGSIVEDGGNHYIVFNQEKYNQGERPLPTTRLVQMAVQILERLCSDISDANGNLRLFRLNNLCTGVEQDAWIDFNAFCEFTGVPATDADGNRFEFSDHQFRRFLAMIYWYRFPDPDLPTLTWWMGHLSSEMTMTYLTDKNGQWEVINEVKNEFIEEMVDTRDPAESSVVEAELREQLGSLKAESISTVKLKEKRGQLLDQYVMHFVKDGPCLGSSPAIQARSKCAVNGVAQISAMKEGRGACKGCPNLIPVDMPIGESTALTLSAGSSPMLSALIEQKESEGV